MKRQILLLFWLLIFAPLVQAQDLYYKTLNVEDGLPSSEVYDVLQDKSGYMWFSTDAGVTRYDGYRFETFTTANGMPDNTVFGLFEDHRGRIWFRTFSGKMAYWEKGKIISIEANALIKPLLNHSSLITSMYVDNGDSLWFVIHAKKDGIYCIPPPYRNIFNKDTKAAGEVFESHLSGQALHREYFFMSDTIRYNFVARDRISRSGIILLPEVDNNTVNARITEHNGQFVFTTKNKLISISSQTGDYVIIDFPDLGTVNRMYFDKSGDLWIAAQEHGIYRYKGGDLKSKPVNFLRHTSVSSFCEDSEGGFWLGTLEHGVLYIPDINLLYFDEKDGLPIIKTTEIQLFHDSILLAAVGNSAVARINTNSLNLEVDKNLCANNQIFILNKDSLIFCGTNTRLWLESEKKVSPVKLLTPHTRLELTLSSCTYNGRGEFWGSAYGYLTRFRRKDFEIIDSLPLKSRINRIWGGNQDTIWLGTMDGLWVYAANQYSQLSKKNPVLGCRIDDFAQLPDGTLLMAAHGNGVLIYKNIHDIRNITTKDGLASDICETISIDDESSIWVTTNKGISRMKYENGNFSVRNYSSLQGLMVDDIHSLCKIGNKLWMTSDRGIIMIDKSRIDLNEAPPQVHIAHVTVNNEILDSLTDRELGYNENFITIDFVGLTYRNFGKTIYRYRLNGLDTAWKTTTQHILQFTTLPPGEYTFEVVALNSRGIPSLKPAIFHFTILPPFWRTWWFLSGIILLTILLIYIIFRIRVSQLEHREAEKTAFNKQVAEMKLMALRAQMNPHFIFNSIHSIQHFILKQDAKAAQKYLSKFAGLIRNVLDNSMHDKIPLQKEIETLQLYVEIEALRFGEKFSYEFIVDPNVDTNHIDLPPLLIQPYVENAIWHGLMHKDGHGMLHIRISQQGKMIRCVIDDDGIGREKSAEYRRMKSTEHRSLGQMLNAERIALNNRLYRHQLAVKTTDKYDEHGNAAGTRVEIEIMFTN